MASISKSNHKCFGAIKMLLIFIIKELAYWKTIDTMFTTVLETSDNKFLITLRQSKNIIALWTIQTFNEYVCCFYFVECKYCWNWALKRNTQFLWLSLSLSVCISECFSDHRLKLLFEFMMIMVANFAIRFRVVYTLHDFLLLFTVTIFSSHTPQAVLHLVGLKSR